MPKKILFIGDGITLSHVVRLLMLSETLDSQQWEIHFAVPAGFDFLFSSKHSHFKRHQLKQTVPGSVFNEALYQGKLPFDHKILKRYLHEDLLLIKHVQPDIILSDFRLTAPTAASILGVPLMNLNNAHWDPGVTLHKPIPNMPLSRRFKPVFSQALFDLAWPWIEKAQLKAINPLRQRFQLPLYPSLQDWYCDGDLRLYADTPFFYQDFDLSPQSHFLGPLSFSPDFGLPETLNKTKKTVYFGMGSSGNQNVIQGITNILGEVPGLQVIFATAGKPLQIKHVPNNFLVQDFVSGAQACAVADLVVGHGGSAVLAQAFSEGKPVLGLPSNLDQFLSMSLASQKGLGLLLRTENFNAKHFRNALNTLLEGHFNTHHLQRVQQEIASYKYQQRFPMLLEQLIATQAQSTAYFHKAA